jgi:hypothetical protein
MDGRTPAAGAPERGVIRVPPDYSLSPTPKKVSEPTGVSL